MSTVIELATAGLREASESLRIAEQEFRNWKTENQPLNTNDKTYLELKAEVIACRAVLAGAQQTLQQSLAAQKKVDLFDEQLNVEQPTETNEQINNVPELASQTNMPNSNSLANILSRPPKIFKFNAGPATDTLEIPLKPIILFTLFWTAILNIIEFCYTLRVLQLFFLAFSCVGIFAVLKREPKFLARFCWAQLIVDILEFIVDCFAMGFLAFGRIPAGLMLFLIIIKFLLKVFFLYCLIKHWDNIREGYVALDETAPFESPISREQGSSA